MIHPCRKKRPKENKSTERLAPAPSSKAMTTASRMKISFQLSNWINNLHKQVQSAKEVKRVWLTLKRKIEIRQIQNKINKPRKIFSSDWRNNRKKSKDKNWKKRLRMIRSKGRTTPTSLSRRKNLISMHPLKLTNMILMEEDNRKPKLRTKKF